MEVVVILLEVSLEVFLQIEAVRSRMAELEVMSFVRPI